MVILMALLAIPVLVYGLFRYRHKRNLYWWLLVVTALLIAVIGVFFLAVAVVEFFRV